VVYAATRDEAAAAGFDDAFIYREIDLEPAERKIPFVHEPMEGASEIFGSWREKGDRRLY
jgi:guanine deaminase